MNSRLEAQAFWAFEQLDHLCHSESVSRLAAQSRMSVWLEGNNKGGRWDLGVHILVGEETRLSFTTRLIPSEEGLVRSTWRYWLDTFSSQKISKNRVRCSCPPPYNFLQGCFLETRTNVFENCLYITEICPSFGSAPSQCSPDIST